METENLNLYSAMFVGIDTHFKEHTALAINRFEEEKGHLSFENSKQGVEHFLDWLRQISPDKQKLVIGIEGGNGRNGLIPFLTKDYENIYEVNPLYTKQRRDYGTSGNKSDLIDAKLIAEILTRKLKELPRITGNDFLPQRLRLRKTVWFYQELIKQGTRLKNQLRPLLQEKELAKKEEKETFNFIIREKRKELERIKRLKEKLRTDLRDLLENQGGNLTTIKGVSVILAARLVAQIGGIERFSRIDKFIKYTGIAPLEKSSGKSTRHIKNKKGNRQLNSTFYLIALNQLRWNPKAKEYFQKKIKEGKTKKQALRCLTKRVACIVYGMLKSKEDYRG